MRTTLTLDDDVAMELKRYALEHRLPFKSVVNAMLRQGLSESRGPALHEAIDPPIADLGGMSSVPAPAAGEDPDGEVARFLRVTQETAEHCSPDRP